MTDASRTTVTELVGKAFDLFGATMPEAVADLTTKVDEELDRNRSTAFRLDDLFQHEPEPKPAEEPQPAEEPDAIGPVAIVRARGLRSGDTVYVDDAWVTVFAKGEAALPGYVNLGVRASASFLEQLHHMRIPTNRLMMIRPRRPE